MDLRRIDTWRTMNKRAARVRRRQLARRQFERALAYLKSPEFAAHDEDIRRYVAKMTMELARAMPRIAEEMRIDWSLLHTSLFHVKHPQL